MFSLKKWVRGLKASRQQVRKPIRRTSSHSLKVEALEDRVTPAKVAVIHASTYASDVEPTLVATGQFSAADVDVFNAGNSTPSVATLNGYDSVIVFSDGGFQDPVQLGNNLASYVNGGGGVVAATFAFNVSPLSGTWASGGYSPLTLGSQSQGTPLTLGSVAQPGHPIMAGVSAFHGGSSSYHNQSTVTAGSSLIASWSNGRPLVAERGGFSGKIVGLNFFPPSSNIRSDFWVASTDGGELLANSLLYAAKESPNTVGVAVDLGSSRLLIFDPATGTQTGLVSIPSGSRKFDAVISPDGKFAYVSDFESLQVWVVDLNTKALATGTNPIPVPTTLAEDLAISSDGRFLLAVDGSGTMPIVVIDTATRSIASTFSTGTSNTGIEVTQNGDVLVGVGQSVTQRFTLSPAGTLTFTGQSLSGFSFNTTAAPNGNFAVATRLGGTVASFAVSGMSQVSSISVPETVVSMAFSADGTKLYLRGTSRVFAFNYNPNTGAIGSQLFTTSPLSSANTFFGVDQLDVIGNRVYTQSGGDVVALDATTGALIGTINVPGASFVGVDLIGVTNRAPTADAGGPYTVAEGSSITLSGAGSDPDGDALTFRSGISTTTGFSKRWVSHQTFPPP